MHLNIFINMNKALLIQKAFPKVLFKMKSRNTFSRIVEYYKSVRWIHAANIGGEVRKGEGRDTEAWYLGLTCLVASSSPSSSVLGSVTGGSSSSSSYSFSSLRSNQGKRHAMGQKEGRWKRKRDKSPQNTKPKNVRNGREKKTEVVQARHEKPSYPP